SEDSAVYFCARGVGY
nr:immunoglobulin heavy chain junction region [Mus musculus]